MRVEAILFQSSRPKAPFGKGGASVRALGRGIVSKDSKNERNKTMKYAKYLLLLLCLLLAACGSEASPEASSTPAPAVSEPDVSKPDASTPDVSRPEDSPVTEPSAPFTEEELDQARQAALDYYAGTVFDVTELVFEEQMANTVSFTVRCSKGGVKVDPDRSIVLELRDGAWTVTNEGY